MISRPGTEGSSWRRPPVAGLSIVMGDVVVMGSTLSKQPSRVRSVRAAARAAQRAASDLVVSMAEAEQGRLMGVEGSGEALPSLRQVLIAAGSVPGCGGARCAEGPPPPAELHAVRAR